ncbi:MAG: hypothetical protein ACR2P0_09575 [Acidimicrobiales bacterium]
MAQLTLAMRVQAVVTAIYGVTFFLVPDFMLDTIFQWDGPDTFWPRGVGAMFLALAWIEWSLLDRLADVMTAVWGFVVLPAAIFIAFVWERAADNYDGSDFFFWTSIAVTVVFALWVGGTRAMAAKR